jgi:hypothetical protein
LSDQVISFVGKSDITEVHVAEVLGVASDMRPDDRGSRHAPEQRVE